MLLVIVASVVLLVVVSVFLLASFSSERVARPQEPRWRAFRNGLRRRHRAGAVEVSLAEMLQVAEPDEVTPFAAFDQVRQKAVEQAARAAGLAAALVAREPAASEPDQVPDEPASDDLLSDLSYSELEIVRAELALAELTLARFALGEPELAPSDDLDAASDPQDGTEASGREPVWTT